MSYLALLQSELQIRCIRFFVLHTVHFVVECASDLRLRTRKVYGINARSSK